MVRLRLKRKYVISILVLASIALFFIIAGTSYAFFTSRVTSKDYVITTGNLVLNYTKTGNEVSLTNTYPMTNTQGKNLTGYTFSITNNGSIDTKYLIRLELDPDNNLPLEYVKMAFVKSKDNDIVTSNTLSNPVLLSSLDNNQVFVLNQLLAPTKTDTYTVKFWLDYSAPNDVQGKSFRAKILVEAIQNVNDEYVISDTTPIITLNKLSDGMIDTKLMVGDSFEDPGVFSVSDDKDHLTQEDVAFEIQYTSSVNIQNGQPQFTTVQAVDTSVAGAYYIIYSVDDSNNNTGYAVRTVLVNNTPTLPSITLSGNSTMTVTKGSAFTDPGVTVANNNKKTTIGYVNTNVAGTYILRYIVVDKDTNAINSVTRTVTVQ